MKLLVFTQAIDTQDPVLGFFHEWIRELATRAEHVEAVGLRVGAHDLPANVFTHGLRTDGKRLRITQGLRVLRLSWGLRHSYEAVFVHMNQEYSLIAGWLWRLLGKRVYLWRNHYAGSLLTDIAVLPCTKVFYTSKSSYTAKYKKAVQMPVGVNTDRFQATDASRAPRSILFLARLAPSKRAEMLLGALERLAGQNVPFTATICGSPLPADAGYYAGLKRQAAALPQISFRKGVPNAEAALIYEAHDIFVNTSPSGMLDKTIFESAASGCLVLTSSLDFRDLAGEDAYFDGTSEDLARKLSAALDLSEDKRASRRTALKEIVRSQSLTALGTRLAEEMTV